MKTAKATIKPAETGRPLGSTIYKKDEFIKKAKTAYKGFLKRGKNPSQTDIAAKLGIGRSTFCRYLMQYHTSWNDIRNDARSEIQ